MKFALSSAALVDSAPAEMARLADDCGYDGIELNVSRARIGEVVERWRDVGGQLACIGCDIAWTGEQAADERAAGDVRALLHSATALGAPAVRILDAAVKPRQNRSAITASLARWLAPLGDYAAGKGLRLLIENALGHRTARELWQLLEIEPRPAIGACWDLLSAALEGESPAISVPVLNSRIGCVQIRDARLAPALDLDVKLGEGDLQVAVLLQRLRGIGYDGWVVYQPRAGATNEMLADAVEKLREWIAPPKPAPKAPAPAAAGAKEKPAAVGAGTK